MDANAEHNRETYCSKCHQAGGTHAEDCPHRECGHDCDCDECRTQECDADEWHH